jgi:outer membrane protein insertion porin family
MVVAFLALSALRAVAQDLPPAVAEVLVEGNQDSETSLVLSRFPLSVGDAYNAALAREGLKDLYALGLFSDVQLLADTSSPGRVKLLIKVVERERITNIRFKGNDKISADELLEAMTLARGQLHDPAAVERARQDILTAYREEGYPLVGVTVVEEPREGMGGIVVSFEVEEGAQLRLRKIRFSGNENVSGDDLRGAMESRTKGFLRSGKFEEAKFDVDLERIAQYYRDHGYRDARVLGYDVDYPESPRDMHATIRVEEGPLYTLAPPTWTGNESVDDELLSRFVPWERGAPYSQAKIRAFQSAITDAFTERGYLLGFTVRPQEQVRPDRSVQVHYAITEGEPSRIGEIRIKGNSRTKEKVIRRELAIYPGEVFRRSALLRSQREVFALGYFDDVRVDFGQPDPASNDIDLELTVEERRLGTMGAGMGYSSATGLTGFLQLGHSNLFGNGWNLNAHLERGSQRSQYELSFTEPWFMDRNMSLGLELFDSEIQRDVYDDRRRGFGVTVGWPMPRMDYTRAFSTFRVQSIDIPYISPSLSQSSIDRLLDGTGTIVSTRFGLTRSSTDNPFYPTSGSTTSWSTELAGGWLGGNVDFHKHLLDHRTYVQPFWKPVVMVRSRLGVLQPYDRGQSVPGYETFRLGGTLFNYLRGYDDYDVVPEENVSVNSLGRESRFPGGRYMATLTVEYQFPIANPLNGLLFMDMGNTWNSVNDVSLNEFNRSVGVGMRMEVPMLGLLGLDYAYGFDRAGGARWKPHLIIGRQF